MIGVGSKYTGPDENSCFGRQSDEYAAVFTKDNLAWIKEITEENFCQMPLLIRKRDDLCSKCKISTSNIGRIYNGTVVRFLYKLILL